MVKPGRVLFEIGGIPEEQSKEALRLAMHKLPVKCKVIAKETAVETVEVAETETEENA